VGQPEVLGNQQCSDGIDRFSPQSGRPAGAARLASFLRTLDDPVRLHILAFLCKSESTSQECAAAVGLAEAHVQEHLCCLADRGYIRARRVDACVCYAVTDSRTAELVQLARSLAADNRMAVSTCVRMDQADETGAGGVLPGS
jgi:hypothetical protein